MSKTPIEQRKQQLQARLDELTSRLNRIEHDLEQPVSPRFEDQATEREEEEVLQDLGQAGQQEIRMIQAALDRVAKGTYGVCVKCGDDISEERLNVLPHTPLCRDCAA